MRKHVDKAAEALLDARMPLIYAGQGVHYAKAWPELKQVAELLEAPVTTSLEGKSAFPENHPLALGSGGARALARRRGARRGIRRGVRRRRELHGDELRPALSRPQDKTFIHNTIEPLDIDKNIPTEYPILGDSKLALAMLHEALRDRLGQAARARARGRGADPEAERAVGASVDAVPHERREAAVAIPRDLRSACRSPTCRTRSSLTMRAARARSCRRSGSP